MKVKANGARIAAVFSLAVVLAEVALVSPAAATVSSASFSQYVSAGALFITTPEGDPIARTYFICANFNPAGFNPAQADTAFSRLVALLGAPTPAVAGPAEIAAMFNLTPTALMQALQNLFDTVGDGYIVLDVKKTAAGVQIDVYRHDPDFGVDLFFLTASFILPAGSLD
ncbi:MAG TPA: hypothetical protein VEL75_04190 [Candidatus Methylomirabilis sp.]|nr:hypothetical protein [Candidatus Methylomirabilis sp.]